MAGRHSQEWILLGVLVLFWFLGMAVMPVIYAALTKGKWRLSLDPVAPPRYRTEADVLRAFRRRLLLASVVTFPVGMILEFYVKLGRAPADWIDVAMVACDTLVMVGMITGTSYLAMKRLLVRRFRESERRDRTSGGAEG